MRAAVARAVRIGVVVAAASCGGAPRAAEPRAIAWPGHTALIRVEHLGALAPDALTFIEAPPPAEISSQNCVIESVTATGRTPLPASLAAILPACWLDGVPVPWEQEVCLLGGHVELHLRHIPVDGGFCFTPATGAWRAVRIDHPPGAFASSEVVRRHCRPVLVDGARALHCEVSTIGGDVSPPGAHFAERMRESHWIEIMRFAGLR